MKTICKPGSHRFALALFAASLLTGCGGGEPDKGPTGTVSGTVTLSGQPLSGGTIRFSADQKTPFGADLDGTGKFTIGSPVLTGTYKVTVYPPAIGPSAGPDGKMRPAVPSAYKSNIPANYQTEQTTDMSQTVNEGENTFTIDLKP